MVREMEETPEAEDAVSKDGGQGEKQEDEHHGTRSMWSLLPDEGHRKKQTNIADDDIHIRQCQIAFC